MSNPVAVGITNTPNRNLTLDVARGLSIALVVASHNWIFLPKESEVYSMLSFRTPFFFFIAGVFLGVKSSMRQLFVSGLDSILKPFFVVLILVGLQRVLAGEQDARVYFFGMFYATGPTLGWTPLWFLPHLFLTRLVAARLVKAIGATRPIPIALAASSLMLVGTTFIDLFWTVTLPELGRWSFLFEPYGHLPGLPWSLDLIPISAAYVLLGYLARERILRMTFRPTLFVGVLLALLTIHLTTHEPVGLNNRLYGNTLIATLQTLLGIYLALSFAALLRSHRLLGGALIHLGASALFVLLFHEWFQSNTIGWLSRMTNTEDNYLVGVIAYLVGLTFPLVLLELVKRQRHLSLLLLPKKIRAQRVVA